MKKVIIEKDIIAYQFDGGENLGTNIYAFISGDEAILLDTGYEKHMIPVKEDLEKENIRITKVIPSHYHPDHIEGIKELGKVQIYGNAYSEETLKKFYKQDEINIMKPTYIVKDEEVVGFGQHSFKFILTPGHSNCSMFILINNIYLHVGDNYMTTVSGLHSLPYVEWEGVKNHILAIEKIEELNIEKIMPSHGRVLVKLSEITSPLKDLKTYMNNLLEHNNKLSIDLALENTTVTFINKGFRDSVI